MARALGLLAVFVAVFVALERGPAVELVVTAAFFVRVAGAFAADFALAAPARVDVVGDGLPAVAVRDDVRAVDPDALFVAAFFVGVAFFVGAAFFAVVLVGVVVVFFAVCFAVVFEVLFAVDFAVDFAVVFAADFVVGAALAVAALAAVAFLAVLAPALLRAAALGALFAVAVAVFDAAFVAALDAGFVGDDFAALTADFVGAAGEAVAEPLVALRPAARATAPFTAPAAFAAVRATAVRAPPFGDVADVFVVVLALALAEPFFDALWAAALFEAAALDADAERFDAAEVLVVLVAAPVLLVAVERVAAVAAAVVFFAAIRSSVARAVDADKWG